MNFFDDMFSIKANSLLVLPFFYDDVKRTKASDQNVEKVEPCIVFMAITLLIEFYSEVKERCISY